MIETGIASSRNNELVSKEEIKDLILKVFENPVVNGVNKLKEDGSLDCMDIGKICKEKGYVLPKNHSWSKFVLSYPDVFDTNIVECANGGTIRIVKLKIKNEPLALFDIAYNDIPAMPMGYKDFNMFYVKIKELGINLSKEELKEKLSCDYPKCKFFDKPYILRKEDGTTEQVSDAFKVPELTRTEYRNFSVNRNKTALGKLYDFAIFLKIDKNSCIDAFQQTINLLASKVRRDEKWYYGNDDPGTNPILKNYFIRTFERLSYEDDNSKDDSQKKIWCSSDNSIAIFNTGLVDNLYTYVYAYFVRNPKVDDARKWLFKTFVNSQDKNELQQIARSFGARRPERANYCNDRSNLVFDDKADIDEGYDIQHFVENCDRIPLEFLKHHKTDFDYSIFERCHTPNEYKQAFANLKSAILSDDNALWSIKNDFSKAIKHATDRAKWNFKTAIPVYYPKFPNNITLLLPLALDERQPDKIDVALAIENVGNRTYIAHTILSLDMAYKDARLLTRPDSDWLSVDNITLMQQYGSEGATGDE